MDDSEAETDAAVDRIPETVPSLTPDLQLEWVSADADTDGQLLRGISSTFGTNDSESNGLEAPEADGFQRAPTSDADESSTSGLAPGLPKIESPTSTTGNGDAAGATSAFSTSESASSGTATLDRAPVRSGVHELGGSEIEAAEGAASAGPATDDQYAERYGVEIERPAEADHLDRLAAANGADTVRDWADEGMPIEAMGRPSKMQRFRDRKDTPVPWDVERRMQDSIDRNARSSVDDSRAGETQVPDSIREAVSSPGTTPDQQVRREMEARMGGSIDDVQLHTGPKAAAAAESIGARAFTVDNHVVFNRGEYQPDSRAGTELLAHELTHVRQQTDGAVSMLPDPSREGDSRADTTVQTQESAGPAEISADASPSVDDGGVVDAGGMEVHVQPKLELGSPGTPAEREAERVASEVVEMDEPAAVGDGPDVQRAPGSAGASDSISVGSEVESTVRDAVSTGGKPLSSSARSYFEPRFGADFSDVTVHTGSAAQEASRAIQARAFTMGSNIAFAEGEYQPRSSAGKELLAHELTHVVQQSEGSRLERRIQRAVAKHERKKYEVKRGDTLSKIAA